MRNLLRRLSCVGFPALLATALIFGSLVSPLPAQSSNNNSSNNGTGKKAIKYTWGQCNAIAKSTGVRCLRGVSTKGATECWQHIIEKILSSIVIKQPRLSGVSGGVNRAAIRQAIRGAKLPAK